MKLQITYSLLQRAIAMVLALALLPVSAANAMPQTDDNQSESIGEVAGADQLAMRNSVTAHKKDKLAARDVLATNRYGRLRAVLRDGSTLSLGANSRLTLLRHDHDARETHVDLSMGRLRSQVIEVTKDGGYFQLTTPQANLTVVGTDFSVDVNPTRTHVVVYSGIVAVKQRNKEVAVSVAAGQNIEVTNEGLGGLQLTSDDVERESIALTALEGERLPQADVSEPATAMPAIATPREGHSNKRRNILIGVAVGAAAAVGLIFATRGDSSSSRPRSIPAE